MKAIKLADLDVLAIDKHLAAEHPGEALPRSRRDRARVHARAHVFPTTHDHGGDLTSVEVAPQIFAVHPLGRFTGRDMKVRQR